MDYCSILFKLGLKILLFTLITANKFIYANTSTVDIAKPLENGISYNTFSELPFTQSGISFNNDIQSNPIQRLRLLSQKLLAISTLIYKAPSALKELLQI